MTDLAKWRDEQLMQIAPDDRPVLHAFQTQDAKTKEVRLVMSEDADRDEAQVNGKWISTDANATVELQP